MEPLKKVPIRLLTRPRPVLLCQAREIHSTHGKGSQSTTAAFPSYPHSDEAHKSFAPAYTQPALAELSLSSVLRTFMITSISSSPSLLAASTSILKQMLKSNSFLVNVDSNPVVRAVLNQTFYKQFCAGESAAEAQAMMQKLQDIGYSGVILEYALEVLERAEEDPEIAVERWRTGLLKTVEMANPGDFVGLKWSGLGSAAHSLLKSKSPPTPSMSQAMDDVCSAASAKSVSLLPAAEETNTNPGYYTWTLNAQRKYNLDPSRRPTVYATYQAYLRATPAILASHLSDAKKNGFTLGIKLVRGAYLSTEAPELLQPSKEGTDAVYDSLMLQVLKSRYGGILQPDYSTIDLASFPKVAVVLATHNAESIRKAQMIRSSQRLEALSPNKTLPDLCYGQLQGMADEVSCELIKAAKVAEETEKEGNGQELARKWLADPPRVYKATTWGSLRECLNYLIRRAAENKDAAGRTMGTRDAMKEELLRRAKTLMGLGD
ncbi:MAG: proline dehydrogenase [Bogoriella megaspora]|nr:MAG: proline dehydrogenase [Bogoriella megaspora]